MKSVTLSLSIAFSLLTAGGVASGQDAASIRAKTSSPSSSVVDEYGAQQAAAELASAPVHSASDLAAFKASHRVDSPLSVLSPVDQRLFEESLTYNQTGVTSFRYDVLKSLTPTQAYKILAVIGMQGFTPNLHLMSQTDADAKIMAVTPSPAALPGYYCKGTGTCWTANERACGDGC